MRDDPPKRSGALILLEGGRLEPIHSSATVARKVHLIERISKELIDELEELLKEFED